MAAPKTMHGARAKLAIVDPQTQQATVVGIFNNVSYGLTYDVQPVFILGRFSAAESVYTGQEVVGITCSGWRVINNGPHKTARVPALKDLLAHEYLELTVIDRQAESGAGAGPGKARIAKFRDVRPTGYTTTISARQLEEITVTFMALRVDDEDTDNDEAVLAADLPAV